MLQNAIETGSFERNTVIIHDDPFVKDGPRNMLRIYSKVRRIFDPELLNALTVQPIVDRQGEVRFGMYLVGMITRRLGGMVHVERGGKGGSAAIQILIPYPVEAQDGAPEDRLHRA